MRRIMVPREALIAPLRPLRGAAKTGKYVLDGRRLRRAYTELEWELFMADKSNWQLAWTDLGGVGYVSTIFLGQDTQQVPFAPLVFETMARIGIDFSEDVLRHYSTWDGAMAGHAELVAEHNVRFTRR